MEIKFVFFGTPELAAEILNILKLQGLVPSLVVTAPDKPQGRGMKIRSPAVKIWARQNGLECLQPEKLNSEFAQTLNSNGYSLFIVVAYGRILTKEILAVPERGAVNLHYSLLPRLRGPSPVETAILENINPTGVTTILMDEKIDNGAILLQKEVYFENWPLPKNEILKKLNESGGKLLAETVKLWSAGKIVPRPQDNSLATYTKKIKKTDGLIDLTGGQEELNYRKFLALQPWPGVYFLEAGRPVKITAAEFQNGRFVVKKVRPAGRVEIAYQDFLRNR